MKNKEPLFHVAKREALPWYRMWLIRVLAVLAALVVCSIVTMAVTKLNPLAVAGSMVEGALGSSRKTWVTIQNTAILLLIALAVTPAFKMRFWNIGAEGQVLISCFAAASCMILLTDKVPNAVLVLIMFLASIAAGAIWAGIPALFKAKWNTNETLFTLMMNYIATQIVACFCIVWENPKGSGTIGLINSTGNQGWVQIGNKYLFAILVAAIVTVLVYVYLNYTKQGYEIAVVGESVRTARYVGIKVDRVFIRTLLLSGAICGLAGFTLVAGVNHTLTTSLAGGRGFTAVMVSWMAQFNPFTMIITSFILVFLSRGSTEIATTFGLNSSFSEILTGIIIFFLIGCEFFIRYKLIFRTHDAKEGNK
ncbi:MAG: ABC transporter permease [Oscillospiraceae bacterium]|nr:ABC transporter permease [Oscillospiraceae bacterium]